VPLALGEPLGVEDPHESDDRVQLVERAVGDDARRILRDALAADQGGLALVAGASVDARDADRHGLLPSSNVRGYSTRRRRGAREMIGA